ncbi:unnamed protein product [Gadus morhua 'NCC']
MDSYYKTMARFHVNPDNLTPAESICLHALPASVPNCGSSNNNSGSRNINNNNNNNNKVLLSEHSDFQDTLPKKSML